MPLLQRPARTPEELDRARPLELGPDQVAELDERAWYARVFRGDDLPQLTLRAVLVGSLLGFLLAFTNLYIGLKTGWGFGVAITACILSFSMWNVLLRARLARSPMSILETNCMQSTASAAGYSTGSTMVSAIAALLMLSATPERPDGQHLPVALLAAWTFLLAVLGVALAVPMKRRLINLERLPFPSGLAAAVTLQSLYSQGGAALKKARALLWAAVGAGCLPLLMDLDLRRTADGGRAPLLPDHSAVLDFLPARGSHPQTGAALAPSDWTLVLDHKLVMIAAGALVGLRVALSMVLGGLLLAYVVGPAALTAGAARAPGSAWRELGVWVGAPILVSSGLLAFAGQWRTIGRALHRRRRARDAAMEAGAGTTGDARFVPPPGVEVPRAWFWTLFALGGGGVIGLGHFAFGIPWPYGVLAVALTYFLALVACRATGESDITPIGAMGKVVQLTYGALMPQNATANLMTAGITAGAATSSADLLVDLKAGYLLGANPRRQFVAQLLGVFAGTAATVLGFHLLVPGARALTGDGGAAPVFPAPAAQAWLAVARVFQDGLGNLHPMARAAIGWGAGVGALLVLLERLLPRARRFLPSATGVGLGFILPFQYPLSMLLGALLAWLWTRRDRGRAELYLVALASGVVAGESIVGVVVAAINNLVLRGG